MPNNDRNWSILTSMSQAARYHGLYCANGIYFSNISLEMTLKQMDFDGDKAGWSAEPWFVEIVKEAIDREEMYPVELPSIPAPAKKQCYTTEDRVRLAIDLLAAPVGLCSNAAMMAWAYLTGTIRVKWTCIWSALATLVIDMAKHPLEVGTPNDALGIITAICPQAAKELDEDGMFYGMNKPKFQGYAKTKWTDDESVIAQNFAGRAIALMSGVEGYSQTIVNNDKGPVLDHHYTWQNAKMGRAIGRMLTFAGAGEISSLNGTLNALVGKNSMWSQWIDETTTEYKQLRAAAYADGEANVTLLQNAEDWRNEHVKEAFYDFCERADVPVDKAFDYLVTGIYGSKNDLMAIHRRRVLWSVFGKEMLANLEYNLMKTGTRMHAWKCIIWQHRKNRILITPCMLTCLKSTTC